MTSRRRGTRQSGVTGDPQRGPRRADDRASGFDGRARPGAIVGSLNAEHSGLSWRNPATARDMSTSLDRELYPSMETFNRMERGASGGDATRILTGAQRPTGNRRGQWEPPLIACRRASPPGTRVPIDWLGAAIDAVGDVHRQQRPRPSSPGQPERHPVERVPPGAA